MKKLILIVCLGLFIFSCGDGESTGEEKQLSDEGRKTYSEGGLTVVESYDEGRMERNLRKIIQKKY